MATEAWDSLCRAFDHYAESGDVKQAVNVAKFPIVLNPRDYKVTQLIARALELVPPDSHDAGRLLSRYGFVLSWETGNYEDAAEAFARARYRAARAGYESGDTDVNHRRQRGAEQPSLARRTGQKPAGDRVGSQYW